jgi:LmbE family N-acetylglucosaminyl deacetylase
MSFALAATTVTMALLNPARTTPKLSIYPRLEAAERQDRVLIVAPHIDDEAIGAGGYAVDALENGAEVFVVFLTAGDCNRFSARLLHKTLDPKPSNYLSVGETRIAEAHEAMSLLGIAPDHYFVLGYPDRGLRSMLDHPEAVVRSRGTKALEVPYRDAMSPGAAYTLENLVCDLRQVISAVNPTVVIAPVPFDLHDDHASAAELTDLALSRLDIRPKRLGYLVHMGRIATKLVNAPRSALLPPSRMKSFAWATYPLSPRVQALKTRVLMTYKSQIPYVFLLRNAFVRSNELFFVYPEAQEEHAAVPARLLLAR